MSHIDYQSLLNDIHTRIQPHLKLGRSADYIPALARVAADRFAMSVHTLEGGQFHVGEADAPFSIQSVSKLFTLAMAFSRLGESIWRRVGREPSGTAFNSLVQLEYENGIPRNPFINAGALVVTDMLLTLYEDAATSLLTFVRDLADGEGPSFDRVVAESERATCHRNKALANLIKSFGNLENPVKDVLDLYCLQCSLALSCQDLARAGLFLAAAGRDPIRDTRILSTSQTKRLNALLLTCGTYDAVGDFAYRVGLPGKSGVGGGILAVIPGYCSVVVWSPGLNAQGNSLAGTLALEWFTTELGISIF